MIDFRYHVVSITAVFLALALGLVIGATSLRGEVAGALESQMTQLRGEKQQLRGQLERQTETAHRQDQFVGQAAPAALEGTLAHRRVAVVALPDTSSSLVDRTTGHLRDADATVTGTTRLDDGLARPDAGARGTLRKAAADMGLDLSATAEDRLAGRVLMAALTGAPSVSADRSQRALSRLVDAGLLGQDPAKPGQAQSVVVVWKALGSGSDEARTVSAWSTTLTTMGQVGRPFVAAADGPQDDAVSSEDALVTELRQSPQVTGTSSTVDDAATEMGQAGVVLALRDEFVGRSGHYGTGKDASSGTPQLGGAR